MKINVLLVEDHINQYKDIIQKIKSFSFDIIEVIDIGPTGQFRYSEYIEKFKSFEPLPLIILVDYGLSWKGRSSNANGEDFVKEILYIYKDGAWPFIIYISGPYVLKITNAANDFEYIDEKANAIALDKSEFDHLTNSKETKLRYAMNKGISYLGHYIKLIDPIITFNDVFEYPELSLQQPISLKNFELRHLKYYSKVEIDIKDILMLIFRTTTELGLLLIITISEGKLIRNLKRIGREHKGFWINKLKVAGIEFRQKTSILYNPEYFEENGKLRAKDIAIFELIMESFNPEFSLEFQSYFEHPFKKPIVTVHPPKRMSKNIFDRSV